MLEDLGVSLEVSLRGRESHDMLLISAGKANTREHQMDKATAAPVTNNSRYVAKITVVGSLAEVTVGLNASERDNLLYDLIQTLPADHHLRQHMHI